MPDRDDVHPSLPYRYQKVGRLLCEGHYDEESLAHQLVRCVKEDVKDYGDAPLRVIKGSAAILESLPSDLQPNDEEWYEASLRIDKEVRRCPGNPRVLSLSAEVCQEQLVQLRYGTSDPDSDLEGAMLRGYVARVCEERFLSRTTTLSRDKNVPWEQIDGQARAMRPHLDREFAGLASQLRRKGTASRLRMPSRRGPARPVDLNEDLDDLGKAE